MTTSELLIETLQSAEIDDVEECVLLMRRRDGSMKYIGVHGDRKISLYEALALVNFARLSIEHDLKVTWSRPD